MKNEIEKRRGLNGLGQRAVDYYVDTGQCVFCDADDCAGIPHDSGCSVGQLSGVQVTEERREQKALERGLVNGLLSPILSGPLREFVTDVAQCRSGDDQCWRDLLRLGVELAQVLESRTASGWARLGEAANLLNQMTELEYQLSSSADLSAALAEGFGLDYVSSKRTWTPRVRS